MLVDSQGYRYTQNGSSSHQVYWRCCYHPKKYGSCPGKAVTRDFYIKQKTGVHKHKPGVPIVKLIHGNSKEAKRLKKMEQADQE